MNIPRRIRISRIAGVAVATLLAACGGGGGGGGAGNTPLSITSVAVDDGVIGTAYNDTVAATGGKGGKTFSISAGTLPAGLSLGATGAITGTPTGPAGTASFTVAVTDSAATPATDSQALTIDIVETLAITTATLADTSVGADYDAPIAVTGGTEPFAFSVVPGTLPAGLSIGSGGTISGTVAAAARSEAFTIRVEDNSSPALLTTRGYTIDVLLEITTAVLPDATSGQPYAGALEAVGGRLPLHWSIASGNLHSPLGLIPSTGEITGTPDAVCAAATAMLDVQVTDTAAPAQSDTRAGIAFTLNPATLDVTSTALANGVIATAYDQAVIASGGMPHYSFAITAGTLPSGLALNASTGRITGIPVAAETQAFDVTVTDACPTTATQSLEIRVTNAPLGRNDSIGNATTLPGDGTYQASISPSGHPNTTFEPDEDYYRITTTATSTITVDINAQVNGSPLDSVIELLNAGGTRLNLCGAPTFTSECLDDDEDPGVSLDSLLQIRVNGAATFYIHVVDWGMDARPDKLYDLVVSGVD